MRRLPLAFAAALLIASGAPRLLGAEDPKPADPRCSLGKSPPPADEGERLALGARYFDHAIQYVARGGSLGKATDLYAHLDAQWDLPENHHEGEQSFWYLAPDKMRTELKAMGSVTVKILDGSKAWTVRPQAPEGRRLYRMHGTPGAENELAQLKEDLVRVQDLTDFVTLEGLKGPGVSFEYQGSTVGTNVYEGCWLKVARRSPDGRKITFWLAYETDPAGGVRATWPGVVRVEGDSSKSLWTEDWVLRDWDSPSAKKRSFRYPFKIEAWRQNPDPEVAKTDPPRKFLTAFVDDILVNAGADPSRFDPEAAAAAIPPPTPNR
jgi:hypothetical protein